MHNCFKLS